MKDKKKKVIRLDPKRDHYRWSDIVKLLDTADDMTAPLPTKDLYNSFQVESDDSIFYVVPTNEDVTIGQDLTPITRIIHRQAADELESRDERGHIEFAFRYRRNGEAVS